MLLEKGRELLHIARELEIRAVKLQQGVENSLRLAVDSTFPVALLSPPIAAFYQQQPLTRLHFTLNPSLLDWRPLTDGQADLLLGALGEPPPLSGYDYLPLGELELLLVVAPHPLARHRAPLSWRTLRRYRAVATGEGGGRYSAIRRPCRCVTPRGSWRCCAWGWAGGACRAIRCRVCWTAASWSA